MTFRALALALVLVALAAGTASAQEPAPEPRRAVSLTLSPIHLIFPVLEVTGEFRAADKIGVAGILAWPGRYCRKLGRELPIATEGRDDGGTNYYLQPEVAAL